jgi:hypothetical protein
MKSLQSTAKFLEGRVEVLVVFFYFSAANFAGEAKRRDQREKEDSQYAVHRPFPSETAAIV